MNVDKYDRAEKQLGRPPEVSPSHKKTSHSHGSPKEKTQEVSKESFDKKSEDLSSSPNKLRSSLKLSKKSSNVIEEAAAKSSSVKAAINLNKIEGVLIEYRQNILESKNKLANYIDEVVPEVEEGKRKQFLDNILRTDNSLLKSRSNERVHLWFSDNDQPDQEPDELSQEPLLMTEPDTGMNKFLMHIKDRPEVAQIKQKLVEYKNEWLQNKDKMIDCIGRIDRDINFLNVEVRNLPTYAEEIHHRSTTYIQFQEDIVNEEQGLDDFLKSIDRFIEAKNKRDLQRPEEDENQGMDSDTNVPQGNYYAKILLPEPIGDEKSSLAAPINSSKKFRFAETVEVADYPRVLSKEEVPATDKLVKIKGSQSLDQAYSQRVGRGGIDLRHETQKQIKKVQKQQKKQGISEHYTPIDYDEIKSQMITKFEEKESFFEKAGLSETLKQSEEISKTQRKKAFLKELDLQFPQLFAEWMAKFIKEGVKRRIDALIEQRERKKSSIDYTAISDQLITEFQAAPGILEILNRNISHEEKWKEINRRFCGNQWLEEVSVQLENHAVGKFIEDRFNAIKIKRINTYAPINYEEVENFIINEFKEANANQPENSVRKQIFEEQLNSQLPIFIEKLIHASVKKYVNALAIKQAKEKNSIDYNSIQEQIIREYKDSPEVKEILTSEEYSEEQKEKLLETRFCESQILKILNEEIALCIIRNSSPFL
jgi:hypothetical protein